jgi:phytoene dehydrogenase-like protein
VDNSAGGSAVVVGSGPNGLAAAVVLARAGLRVTVLEGADTPGGGCRTEALTLEGFAHDVCSAVHPMVAASPFLRDVVSPRVTLCTPDVSFVHPLDDGRAAVSYRSLEATAEHLGADGPSYRGLMGPLLARGDAITSSLLRPLLSLPRHPLAMGRFAAVGTRTVEGLARRFETDEGRALLAGVGAHAMTPLDAPLTGGFALFLALLAHHTGWPVVAGGSARIVDALVAELETLNGSVRTGCRVRDLGELPPARVRLLDVSPSALLEIVGSRLPARTRRALRRYRYGPGVCKVDWALDGPVPWTAPDAHRTLTLHVGGTLAEVASAEREVAAGRHPEHPFCIVAQPSVLDAGRAPDGRHTLWGYCHVPGGSTVDMTPAIEDQIERFAPGFRDRVLARATRTASQVEAHNPNYVGGDIAVGAATVRQTVFRPSPALRPYRTGIEGLYLCSSATPPGGGVHGMCGVGAARVALGDLRIAVPR